jgi:hypothetical protein
LFGNTKIKKFQEQIDELRSENIRLQELKYLNKCLHQENVKLINEIQNNKSQIEHMSLQIKDRFQKNASLIDKNSNLELQVEITSKYFCKFIISHLFV